MAQNIQTALPQIRLRDTKGRVVLSLLFGALITGSTYFVSEGVVASFGHGYGGSASVSGFPFPYLTFVACCESFGGSPSFTLDNTYFLHPLSLASDLALWSVISFTVLSSFSRRRLLFSSISGVGATLLSLLSRPLWLVAPTPSLETSVLKPMGFPFQYLTYYVTGFPLSTISRGYQFDWISALADFAFWFGVAFSILAILVGLEKLRTQHKLELLKDEENSVPIHRI